MLHNNEIKVLMMLDSFAIGGTETYVLSLTEELLKQGVSVYVGADSGPLKSKFDMLRCKIYNYKSNKQKFEEWIRINGINLIHAHSDINGSYALELSQKLNIPLIYSIHGTYYSNSILQHLLTEFPIQPSIISVSEPVQRWLKKKGIYSSYVPNGSDTNEFHAKKSNLREKLAIPENAKVILYASRLEYEKYKICKLLLEAYENKITKKFPDVHLLIAGGGLKADKIIKSINKQNKTNHIQYIGNRVDMPEIYSISDYVVGTGRVALEALCCERPVIAIGTYGIFGLVEPDNFDIALKYYFCDHKRYLPLNINNITNAVKKALLHEDEKMQSSKILRQKVQQRFDVSFVCNEICNIYKKKITEVKK